MDIIELQVLGRRSDEQACEDAVFVSDHFVAVLDGATDKTGLRLEGMSGGRFAVLSVLRTLGELEPGIQAQDFFDLASGRLARDLMRAGAPVGEGKGPQLSIVVFSGHHKQVWRVGDTAWRMDGRRWMGNKLSDGLASQMRAAALRQALAAGTPMDELAAHDPGREAILPFLRMFDGPAFRNADPTYEPLAFGVMDGTPIPACYQEIWKLPAQGELAMASDGYPMLLDTLAETEAYLAKDLAQDPLRIGRHPSTKAVMPGARSFDDRAWVRFSY